jgi:hypothetical protein
MSQLRSLWEEFAWRDIDAPGAEGGGSIEPTSDVRGPVDDAWGRSESFDPDNVGDIADEGAGHRG